MMTFWNDVFKIVLGAIISISSSFILLMVENKKQIIAKKHDLAIKDLGDKLFSPLLNELALYETKKKLGKNHTIDLVLILDCIRKNQFLLLFTTSEIEGKIKVIYEFATSSTQSNSSTVDTQDEIIIQYISELKYELQEVYSRYRM